MAEQNQQHVCPLCGNRGTVHFKKCVDFAVSKEQYELVQCPECGVIFTLDTPDSDSSDTYSKLQQELYRADHPKRLFDRIYYNMRFVTIRRRIKLVESLTRLRSGRLLNYGAKSGYFSSRMADRGWNVTSLEQYHEHRVFSLEMFHHRMMDLPELDNLPVGTFDMVTLWHTFEHHPNPSELADKMYSLLKPNGLLLIACPNTDSLDAQHYGEYWAAWDVPRHRWHFNPTSLMEFCRRHRFILMYHKRIPFDVFYISMLSERYRGKFLRSIRGIIKGTYFWLMTFSRRDKSSSIVYVFRKKID